MTTFNIKGLAMDLKDKIGFFKVCFDSMQLGILVCDAQGNIQLANEPLEATFGYTTEDLETISSTSLFAPDSEFVKFVNTKSPSAHYNNLESIGIRKNGEIFPIEINLSKLEYEDEWYNKVLVTDISIRKEKEMEMASINVALELEVQKQNEELEKVIDKLKASLNREKELNHLKTKFIALASHEFKTPLSAILSSAELIIKYADLNKIQIRYEHVRKIKTMIYHLNGMLDDLLTLENIELGNINPDYSLFKCSTFIKKAINNTRPILKKDQELIFDSAKDDLIYHDAKMLQIILSNLLNNAVKYSGEEGRIVVKMATNDNEILFSVEDNGIGIPQQEQDLIFNRFFRAKNVLHYPGTGIGLNIVKGYVQSLKGFIDFESKENEYTKFNVILPKNLP